ncbi:hypothetical protein [Pseudalkalibacillus hwajinpoensis]|uniref:Uncharacterized protein n=1 Tax=Guptibacillus hwajinpoensis TaxID=208199 RepID=A0A4U1M7A5_9BACL|nr:hypothetical protein [Pseudalkalibacillus hwajinpoensis]TKD65706.1 hypothetical protein FBF83_20475 [Pseudalkalibacillus hwajinpoensis]
MRIKGHTRSANCVACFRDFEPGNIVAYLTVDEVTVCQRCANDMKQQPVELREVLFSDEEEEAWE